VEAGDLAGVKRAVDEGADPNARGPLAQTPLIIAAHAGDTAIVECLLAGGADHTLRDEYGDTALLEAASNFHVEVVRTLLDWRADPRVRNNGGSTPLGYCVLYDGERVLAQAKLLLERGADPDERDSDGDPILMQATHEPELVKLLIEHRADLRLRDRQGRTALRIAYEECDYEAAELLEAAGATL
jgi:ankyrin repeat protein